MAMLCDNTHGHAGGLPAGSFSKDASVKVRGIGARGSQYHAFAQLSFVMFESRVVPLVQALDHLLILTDIMQKAKVSEHTNLADRLEEACHTLRGEHSVSYADMRLSIRLRIRYGFWIGRQHKLN